MLVPAQQWRLPTTEIHLDGPIGERNSVPMSHILCTIQWLIPQIIPERGFPPSPRGLLKLVSFMNKNNAKTLQKTPIIALSTSTSSEPQHMADIPTSTPFSQPSTTPPFTALRPKPQHYATPAPSLIAFMSPAKLTPVPFLSLNAFSHSPLSPTGSPWPSSPNTSISSGISA